MVVGHFAIAFQVETQVPVEEAAVPVVVVVVVAAEQANTGLAQNTAIVVPVVGLANHELKFVTTAGPVIADSRHDNCNSNPADHATLVETQCPYKMYRAF